MGGDAGDGEPGWRGQGSCRRRLSRLAPESGLAADREREGGREG